MLQLRFTLLEGKSPQCSKLSELRHFYCLRAADVEGERQRALTSAAVWDVAGISAYYDQQHHQLVDRVERSLALVEAKIASQPASPPTPSSPDMTSGPTAQETQSKPSPPAALPLTECTRRKVLTARRPSIIQPLNPVATSIMTNWYNRHEEHPYPSYEAAEVMAKAGNVTVEQVKKWFANRRRRAGNTKTLTEVAQRRKRVRQQSCDFLVGGAMRAR